jgi:hypothetical protein
MRSCGTDFGQSYANRLVLLLLLLNRRPSSCEAASRSLVPRALWSGVSGFAARGSGRALASVHLVAPSLFPEKPGPRLCFLPAPKPEVSWGGHKALPLPGHAWGRSALCALRSALCLRRLRQPAAALRRRRPTSANKQQAAIRGQRRSAVEVGGRWR